MRNPLPVLVAAMLAAIGALAADLPTWKTADDGPWREIDFTDAAGTYHSLYCPWAACGTNRVKTGQAKLYVLQRGDSVPYTTYVPYHAEYSETYAGKTWEWLKVHTGKMVPVQSAKTNYKSQLSHFVLDIAANKAIIPGTDVALAVLPPHDSVDNVNPIWRVEQPSALADDAPKPVPPKPEPKPGHTPLPRPRPTPKQPQPKPKPGTHTPAAKATELSGLERGWMIPTERTAYDDSVDAAKKPTAAALQAAYKKGRDVVAANLRDELKAPYATLVGGGQYAKIDDLLAGKNYAGFETKLKPEEYEALKKVLKTAGHADFVAPNAAAQYDLEMKTILGPDGNPKISEHLLAHKITEKFRAMVPKAPGQQVDPAAPLTDADWAKITVPADRDAMKKQYDADWAKTKSSDEKIKVNQDYRAKIDAWVKAHPPTPPSTGFDPSKIKTLDQLKALAPDDQKKFCSALTSDAGSVNQCGDILANADAAATKCMTLTGADATATAKAKNDCMAKINACKATPNASTGIPSAGLPKDMRDYCATLLAGANPPPTTTIGTGGSAINNSPCPGAKGKADASTDAKKDPTTTAGSDVDPCKGGKDEKKSDPHFYDNLGNGIAFGIGGMLLGSFFGGPLMILAVGLAAGVGGYYFAKANDEPKKKK